jgi:hypothetical protein
MQWTSKESFAALRGVTGDFSSYSIRILEVPLTDDLPVAAVEFWSSIIAKAIEGLDGNVNLLLFDVWPDAGMIDAVFTDRERSFDDPAVFKLISEELSEEYERLPSPREDLDGFRASHEELIARYFELIERSGKVERVVKLLTRIRHGRSLPVFGTVCSALDRQRSLEI